MPADSQLADWLDNVWLFACLDLPARQMLCEQAERRVYEPQAVIIRQGAAANEALLMLSGSAMVTRIAGNRAKLAMRLLKPGDLVGEMGLICDQVRSATVVAHEASQALVITRDAFQQLIREKPAFALRMMEMLCQRIVEGNHVWELAQAYWTDARVASLLLDLAERFPAADAGTSIGVRLTHAELAAMLGIARENVTKALARLRRAGAIATRHGRVEILDQAELRSWIC